MKGLLGILAKCDTVSLSLSDNVRIKIVAFDEGAFEGETIYDKWYVVNSNSIKLEK